MNDPHHRANELPASFALGDHHEPFVRVMGNDRPSVYFLVNDRHEMAKSNHGTDHNDRRGILLIYPPFALLSRMKTMNTSSPRVDKGTDVPCRDTVETAFMDPRYHVTVSAKVCYL